MFQPTSPTLDNKEHDIYPLNNCGRQEQKMLFPTVIVYIYQE